jgi:hypothetical protein
MGETEGSAGNAQGTFTITNINSDFEGYFIRGLVPTDMILQLSGTVPFDALIIQGSSMVLNVFQWLPGGDWKTFTENTTIKEGELVFILTGTNPQELGPYDIPPSESTYAFTNSKAIIFTNGSAAIDFSSMVETNPYLYMSTPG